MSEPLTRLVLDRVAGMAGNPGLLQRLSKHDLTCVNVMWEDTARYEGSCVGPNISDLTLRVRQPGLSALLPVIRPPNFSDRTADVPLDAIRLRVGNERDDALRVVSLREILGDLRAFLSAPESWPGEGRSLLADRDTHALVSAQACFLPVPKGATVEFDPVLFNYQTRRDDPAVLALVATREGTSTTVIDGMGSAEDTWWGQTLFFNEAGQRARFTGRRRSDVEAAQGAGGSNAEDLGDANVVLLVQVPLKQHSPPEDLFLEESVVAGVACAPDVEQAVIGHGEVLGPFEEIRGHAIERDPRFPVRVTVQLYQATSNGLMGDTELERFRVQLARVYDEADYVGSLVTDPTGRPTAHDGERLEPPGWWADFWARYAEETGLTARDTLRRLRELNGGRMPTTGEEASRLLARDGEGEG